jgi:flagellar basal body-associated protein FliL
MKKVLLTLLGVVIVLGVVGAAGFTGYRLGYSQGAQAASNGETPNLRPFDRMGPDRSPFDRFGMDHGFQRGMRGFPMMGFGVFSLLRFLAQIAVLALIVWFAYWLLTRSGWRLTRQTAQVTQNSESAPPPTDNES